MKYLIFYLLPFCIFAGCSSSPKGEINDKYILIRPASTVTNDGIVLDNPALYRKLGETNKVYMESLDGSIYIPLPN